MRARCAAEATLAQFKLQPQGALTALQLITQQEVPEHVRQAGAVLFKNLTKERWVPADEPAAIPDAIKAQVKAGLLQLILCVPERLQTQLGTARP